jgi:predicted acylesterase/phospholipase RssA/CRP-like cAMP-binding protein
MARAEVLRGAPVLAGLSDELLEQLAAEAGEVTVRAGEWLFREGERAESLYVIRSGRLEVVAEGPPETLIRLLRRGDALGELALLHAGVRSASVRARRDSDLLELSRERFERLIRDVPAFAVALTRTMGAQLAANRAPAGAPARPSTIAVVPLDAAAPAREVADLLLEALGRFGGAAELGDEAGRTPGETLNALDRAEELAERVLMVATEPLPGERWTDLCLREADLIVAVAARPPAGAWSGHPALRGCELIAIEEAAAAPSLGGLAPRETQALPVRAELAGRVEALARRLCGQALGVVLSGGGARAFAHLGVVEELAAAGLVPDRIAGVSLGSVVGAGLAFGHDPETLAGLFRRGFVETNPTGDYTLPLFSLIRGRRTRELLCEAFGERRIEELATRFFCLSCDLVGRESVVHRTGRLRDAVYPSLSIPGLFPPVPTADGRLLVDGGVLDNLPVETMAAANEGPVIAVDVSGRVGGFGQGGRPGLERFRRPLRRFLTGGEAELPRLGETVVRTVTVGSIDTADAARRHADLVIAPEVDGIGLLDWKRLERVREIGREAARSALERWEGLAA